MGLYPDDHAVALPFDTKGSPLCDCCLFENGLVSARRTAMHHAKQASLGNQSESRLLAPRPPKARHGTLANVHACVQTVWWRKGRASERGDPETRVALQAAVEDIRLVHRSVRASTHKGT